MPYVFLSSQFFFLQWFWGSFQNPPNLGASSYWNYLAVQHWYFYNLQFFQFPPSNLSSFCSFKAHSLLQDNLCSHAEKREIKDFFFAIVQFLFFFFLTVHWSPGAERQDQLVYRKKIPPWGNKVLIFKSLFCSSGSVGHFHKRTKQTKSEKRGESVAKYKNTYTKAVSTLSCWEEELRHYRIGEMG